MAIRLVSLTLNCIYSVLTSCSSRLSTIVLEFDDVIDEPTPRIDGTGKPPGQPTRVAQQTGDVDVGQEQSDGQLVAIERHQLESAESVSLHRI